MKLTDDQQQVLTRKLARITLEQWDRFRDLLFPRQREVYDAVRGELSRARAEFNRILAATGGDLTRLKGTELANVAPKPVFVKTPRRGAKTTLAAGIQLDDAQRNPGMHYPFIAITGPAARGQAWPVFKWWRDKLNLPLKMNEGDMSWVLESNGASGKLWGADRDDLHRSLLGGKNRIVVVDEGAYWKTDLAGFYRDKIEPTVADNMGLVMVLSAPSEFLRGFFYDHTRDDDPSLRLPGAHVYTWSTDENPHMAIQLAILRKKWEAADPNYRERPWYRRQWGGEWVAESSDAVWRFDRFVNVVDPGWTAPYGERYILGLDSGYTDGMAYVLMSYNPTAHANIVIHAAEWYTEENTDQIAQRIEQYVRQYNAEVVIDPNNAQLVADLDELYGIPTEPAQKTDKLSWIRTVNTLYDNGTIRLVDPEGACAPLLVDLEGMKKKYDKDTKVETLDDGTRIVQGPGTWEIDLTSAPGHCGHAMLYGVRHSYPHWHQPEPHRPAEGTPEWVKQQTAKMREGRKGWVKKHRRARKRVSY